MIKNVSDNKPFDLIKLAAMECVSSCVMTALKLKSRDHRFFMLGYWNLSYSGGNLLSSSKEQAARMSRIYGLQSRAGKNSKEEMVDVLSHGGILFYICRASKLPFFPQNLLTHDGPTSYHSVVLHRFDLASDSFGVMDPTADYSGELESEMLLAASMRKHELTYHVIEFLEEEIGPLDLKQLFREASSVNLTNFRDTGVGALDHFIEDLKQLDETSHNQFEMWIHRNNITLTSIIRIRKIIWSTHLELGLIPENRTSFGETCLEEITKGWMSINFLLMKYKRTKDRAILETIQKKVTDVMGAEIEMLCFLQETAGLLS